MTDEPYAALLGDLAAEHVALDAVVANLSQADWSRSTPAEGWTIRDTILHLALTDEAAAWAAADPAAFEAYRERRRAGRDPFDANRNMPEQQLRELWRVNRAGLLQALHGLDPRSRVTWFGPPMSAMSHATARLMETWAHGQDVFDTLGRVREPTARLRHIAHLGVRTRSYSYAQRGLTLPEGSVRVELSAPDGTSWTWGDASAADLIAGPALDFCLVVVQRRHVDDTCLMCDGPHAREWLLIAQAFAGEAGAGRQPGQFRGPTPPLHG